MPHPVLSITSGFSNTTTLQRRLTTTTVGRRSCHTHENCMHAEQIIIISYIFFLIFCSLYLLLFLIVLYRTIVTVYNDNSFLYDYLWQMHQIIHLSLLGCFTPARSKTLQKNREVSGVNTIGRVIKISSAMAQPCIQELWYSRGKPLNNYFSLKLGQARPKITDWNQSRC